LHFHFINFFHFVLCAAAEMGSPNALGMRDSPLLQPMAPTRANKPTSTASTSADQVSVNLTSNNNNDVAIDVAASAAIVSNSSNKNYRHLTPNSIPTYSLASIANVTSVSAAASSASTALQANEAKQLLRVRRFLSTLHQFACEISPETGANAQNLIFNIVVSVVLFVQLKVRFCLFKN
jgi:hypothetical protein